VFATPVAEDVAHRIYGTADAEEVPAVNTNAPEKVPIDENTIVITSFLYDAEIDENEGAVPEKVVEPKTV